VFILFEQLDGETHFDVFPHSSVKDYDERKSAFIECLSMALLHPMTLFTELVSSSYRLEHIQVPGEIWTETEGDGLLQGHLG